MARKAGMLMRPLPIASLTPLNLRRIGTGTGLGLAGCGVDSLIVIGAMDEPGEGPRSPARGGQGARQRLAKPLPRRAR